MNVTTIENRLQERWELQGHTVSYLDMSTSGSTLSCAKCLREVEVVISEHGGWRISNRSLDTPCQ